MFQHTSHSKGHKIRNVRWSVGSFLLLAALSLGSGVLVPATAEDDPAVARGLEISTQVDIRDNGFGDLTSNMKMVLRGRRGEESARNMRSNILEVEGDGDKSLVIFDEPTDVKGTAFLSFTHKSGPDDQWLYLPALKRVKRIASNNKSGPFMGSEFAYEDISSQEVEKYTYKYIKDEVMDGVACYVVERYPVDPKSGYTRQLVWIDSEKYIPHKIDFYDRKESLLKTLTFHGYNLYAEKHWRPDEMKMVNHQTGKSTDLRWTEYKFKTGLTDRDFDRNSLKRAR